MTKAILLIAAFMIVATGGNAFVAPSAAPASADESHEQTLTTDYGRFTRATLQAVAEAFAITESEAAARLAPNEPVEELLECPYM